MRPRSAFNGRSHGGSYPVPVAIIDGEGNAAGYVPVAQIVTKTHLSIFDLQEGRHAWGRKNTVEMRNGR